MFLFINVFASIPQRCLSSRVVIITGLCKRGRMAVGAEDMELAKRFFPSMLVGEPADRVTRDVYENITLYPRQGCTPEREVYVGAENTVI